MAQPLPPLAPNTKDILRALWARCSAAIVAGTITVSNTYTIWGTVYTVAVVNPSAQKFGQIILTDPNGYEYCIPNYACPTYVYS